MLHTEQYLQVTGLGNAQFGEAAVLCSPFTSCSPNCWWKAVCMIGKSNGNKSILFLTFTTPTHRQHHPMLPKNEGGWTIQVSCIVISAIIGFLTDWSQENAVQDIPLYIYQYWTTCGDSGLICCCSTGSGKIQDGLQAPICLHLRPKHWASELHCIDSCMVSGDTFPLGSQQGAYS